MAWMKAAIQIFVKRAGGWCKPVRVWIFPLSELLVMNQKAGNLYLTFVEGVGSMKPAIWVAPRILPSHSNL